MQHQVVVGSEEGGVERVLGDGRAGGERRQDREADAGGRKRILQVQGEEE